MHDDIRHLAYIFLMFGYRSMRWWSLFIAVDLLYVGLPLKKYVSKHFVLVTKFSFFITTTII